VQLSTEFKANILLVGVYSNLAVCFINR